MNTPQWPSIQPLDGTRVPEFPVEALPSPLREYVAGLAESLQVPVDLPAMLMLATGGAATANKLVVQINPDWQEPTNLYVAVVLPPAHRKSAIFKAITVPISAFERRHQQRVEPVRQRAIEELQLKQENIKQVERRVLRGDQEERDEAIREAATLRDALPDVPLLPRELVDDVSPEKLAMIAAENHGRIALMSSEGGVFETMAGRYSNGIPNLDVYLKGHCGDSIHVDRIGRPSVFVPNPAITIAITAQPDVIQGLAGKPGFRGRGLLGRFLYSVPRSLLGMRRIDTTPVDPTTRARYEEIVLQLLDHEIATNSDGAPAPRPLCLDPHALECFRDYQEEIERKLGPCGRLEHISDWGGKLVGAVARIAGILHAIIHATNPAGQLISGNTMLSAIRIGAYLEVHALAVLDVMDADPVMCKARHVLAWIERFQVRGFSQRDAQQALRGRFRLVDQLMPILRLLQERGYLLRVQSPKNTGPGRTPGPTYIVNPAYLNSAPGEPQNPQNTQNVTFPGHGENIGNIVDFVHGPVSESCQ